MDESNISQWKSAFDDLVIELQDVEPPQERTGHWVQALAEFSRHSFARVLLSPDDEELRLRLEIALGPPDGNSDSVVTALSDRLSDISQSNWEVSSGAVPWVLETRLKAEQEQNTDRLRRVLLEVIGLCEHFESVTSFDEWKQIVGGNATDADADEMTTNTASGDSPFETIGDGAAGEGGTSTTDATIESTATVVDGDELTVVIGFAQVLANRQVRALQHGLEHHLHTKFDVQVRPDDDEERLEASLSVPVRTALGLQVTPGGFDAGMETLRSEIDDFLQRLEKFSSFGVDLFEYLGVGETIFEDAAEVSRREEASESQLSFRRRATGVRSGDRRRSEPSDDGVVLDLGSATSTATRSLEPKNYTDPRLQRRDSDAPLVDLVLRHPGYSDRRIGQVLSILLSIEYHAAVEIADSAPCVIAWGIGQQRARSFQEIIESAGGKVLLVEPGTFGES